MSQRVIVAGAGPVGLVTATYLAERGVPVTVLEAEPSLPENLRASTFHPPTLDLLDRFGATDKLLAMGLKAPPFNTGRATADVSPSSISARSRAKPGIPIGCSASNSS
jgi:2-polyprenyl-6-methoxyphenol hydroxylase-like FAD-dependent oxidoreductase